MILFLYGEDTYRSKQKLDSIRRKYIDASLGDTNLAKLNAKDLNFEIFVRQVQALPFLAKTRLVIVNNLLSNGAKKLQEKILEYLPKISVSTNLIFYEDEKFDKRNALYKKLIKNNKFQRFQEFKPLSDYQLRDWIKQEIESLDAKIEPEAIEKLILYVRNDLWRMENEIEKLVSYCHSERVLTERVEESDSSSDPSTSLRYAQDDITTKYVELLVRPKITANVFDLIDGLGQKNLTKEQQELHKLLDSGENELYILTMIVYQFRNLLIIKDLIENSKSEAPMDYIQSRVLDSKIGTRNSKQVSKFKIQNSKQILNHKSEIVNQSGLHPFVVQKTMIQCHNFTIDQLKKIYQKLLEYDIKIKTGEVEPKLALDLLVVELCSKK